MFKEFKEFALKGNVADMAIGLIMGAAFGSVVNSMVKDVLMPPIGKLIGGVDFSNLFFALDGTSYASLLEAQKAGAATLNVGLFINTIISFTITAAAMFLIVKGMNTLKRKEAAAPAAPPPPSPEQKLLTEIRDLLAARK